MGNQIPYMGCLKLGKTPKMKMEESKLRELFEQRRAREFLKLKCGERRISDKGEERTRPSPTSTPPYTNIHHQALDVDGDSTEQWPDIA